MIEMKAIDGDEGDNGIVRYGINCIQGSIVFNCILDDL